MPLRAHRLEAGATEATTRQRRARNGDGFLPFSRIIPRFAPPGMGPGHFFRRKNRFVPIIPDNPSGASPGGLPPIPCHAGHFQAPVAGKRLRSSCAHTANLSFSLCRDRLICPLPGGRTRRCAAIAFLNFSELNFFQPFYGRLRRRPQVDRRVRLWHGGQGKK